MNRGKQLLGGGRRQRGLEDLQTLVKASVKGHHDTRDISAPPHQIAHSPSDIEYTFLIDAQAIASIAVYIHCRKCCIFMVLVLLSKIPSLKVQ